MTVEEYSGAPVVEELTPKRKHTRVTLEDAKRWADMYADRLSILKIADSEKVAPSTVSKWLKKVGLDIKQGQHRVEQPSLRFSESVVDPVSKGPEEVLALVKESVWGLQTTTKGIVQLGKFCKFVGLHTEGKGVKEIAGAIGVHRSTVTKWRKGTDEPYLVKLAIYTVNKSLCDGWKLLPLWLESGGNNVRAWIDVPSRISAYADIERVVEQTRALESTYTLGSSFGLTRNQVDQGRCEWFAYLLGFMLGDASKGKSAQERFKSMGIDLQLTKKWPTNERTGDFVCMTANSLGFQMGRIRDKPPTGYTKMSRNPTAAFRWTSERSPFFAWMFRVGLGLRDDQTTSLDQVRMDWIFETPYPFRRRFVQGLADSDGSVKKYLVEITSLPNSEFTTSLLHSLDLPSAYTRWENGIPIRSVVKAREAVNLPIFNEFVRSYRYQKLLLYKQEG